MRLTRPMQPEGAATPLKSSPKLVDRKRSRPYHAEASATFQLRHLRAAQHGKEDR